MQVRTHMCMFVAVSHARIYTCLSTEYSGIGQPHMLKSSNSIHSCDPEDYGMLRVIGGINNNKQRPKQNQGFDNGGHGA